MRSCVRLARSAKSFAPAETLSSWESSLLFAADGFTGVAAEALVVLPSSPFTPTDAAAIPATPMTHTDGTATVSSADRFAGARRRARFEARAATREAGAMSSSSSSSDGVSPGASPSPDSPSS